MSTAAAELPTLSTMDQSNRPRVITRLDTGLGRVAFFVVPSAVAFVVAGESIVTLVYLGDRFSPNAVVQIATVLSVLGLGLLASTSSRLLQSALYGAGDARSPAIYAVIRVIVGLSVGVTLMFPLDAVMASTDGFRVVREVAFFELAPLDERTGTESLYRLGAAGLAFGAVVGAWVELALLRIRVRILFGRVRLGGPCARSIAAAAVAATMAGIVSQLALSGPDLPPRVEALLVLLAIGGSYVSVARARGVPEARELLQQARLEGR